jgi:hypothetical protein
MREPQPVVCPAGRGLPREAWPAPQLMVHACHVRARTSGKLRSSAVTHGHRKMASDLCVPSSKLSGKRTPKQ